jgi:F-type H+-transporting ATPase subunit a
MDLLHHFELHPIVGIHLFGIDLSITKAVVMMWIACCLTFLLLVVGGRRAKIVPSGVQNFVEAVVDFLRTNMILETLGEEGLAWFPFIATLFFFILFCNLLGLIPGAFTATSNINVTATLAIVVFFCTQAAGVAKHGIFGYLKKFVPKDIPIFIIPIMLPIEIVSQLAKPFSLAVRLFANMTAGHGVILVFLFMIIMFKSWMIAVVPLIGVVVMSAFEIFVALIQAYIFATLAAMYIAEAIQEAH